MKFSSCHKPLILLLLLMAAYPTPAQDGIGTTQANPQNPSAVNPQPPPPQKHESPAGRFLRDVWIDQKAIWTSPVRMNRRQFFTIALPLAAATAGLVTTDDRAGRWLPNTPDQIRWSKRVSTLGTFYTLGGIVGSTMVVGKVRDKPEVFRMGRLSAESFVNAVVVSQTMKWVASRERPDQNKGEGRFWKGGWSFPSGHAMNSWAIATAVARSPKCPKWLAITSYSAASIVSLSRWGARKHFPSDILVGAVFGGLIGNYVATRPR